MNELELVSQIVPAKADFNYDAINEQLDVILLKYKGLIFTDETISDCKKTLAELRKSQKELHDFKVETKKTLNKAVDDFEAKCKLLDDKIVLVIEPISSQAAEFEIARKEDKKVEIQEIINYLIIRNELVPKYSVELIIIDHMLNKGTTIKAITTDLTAQADNLLLQQSIEKSNILCIQGKVKLVNKEFDIMLLDTTYLDMMERRETLDIVKQIDIDSEALKAKRIEKEIQDRVFTERVEAARVKEEEKQKKEAELLEVARVKEIERQAQVEVTREIEKAKQLEVQALADKEATALQETFKAAAEEAEAAHTKKIEEARETQEVNDFNKVENIEVKPVESEIKADMEVEEDNELIHFITIRVFGSGEEVAALKKHVVEKFVELEILDEGTL